MCVCVCVCSDQLCLYIMRDEKWILQLVHIKVYAVLQGKGLEAAFKKWWPIRWYHAHRTPEFTSLYEGPCSTAISHLPSTPVDDTSKGVAGGESIKNARAGQLSCNAFTDRYYCRAASNRRRYPFHSAPYYRQHVLPSKRTHNMQTW